tara:strand:- start:1529 stop:1759 length:231 start_codon:yes stop_codon:yes gene_type:complete
MAFYNIARLIKVKYHFICQMCGLCKNGKLYQYKALSIVPRYKPSLLEICEDCIYKEVYGSKTWRKMKKEGALNGNV